MTTLATRPSESFAQSGSHPRFRSVPSANASLGDQCIQFAARCGLFLDPWQQDVLRGAMGRVPGGRWAARNVGLLVPRQNGKGAILEARELFGMFVLNEPLIIHSAHRFDSSQEHFGRIQERLESNPDLKKHVASVFTANGKESIRLKNGCRLKFKARTNASMRGFSCETLILDEAMILADEAAAAMRPALISRPEAQIWYTSSSGTPESTVLWRLVKRGREGAKRLAYWEWGCPLGADPADKANWFAANPALGIRLAVEDLEDEFDNGLPEDFAREHLGIWDEASSGELEQAWKQLYDPTSMVDGVPMYGLAVADDRSWACVGAAGAGPQGQTHVEYGKYAASTSWVVEYLADLAARRSVRVAVRVGSQAASLIDALEGRKVDVTRVSMADYAGFCGNFHDSVTKTRDIRHHSQTALDISVSAAQTRRHGDAFVWEQRNPHTDISPLEAVTLAYGCSRRKKTTGRFMAF